MTQQLGAESSRRGRARSPRCPPRWTARCGAGRRRSATPRPRSRRSGAGRQTARATGSLGSGCGRRDHVDLVGDQPEPVAEVGEADDDGRPGRGVEHQPDRVLPAADAQRVDLAARGGRRRWTGRPPACARRGSAPRPGTEVVGVVLHEGGAAGQAVGHRPSACAAAPRSSSRPRRRSRSRRPSAAARPGRAAGAARRGPRSWW